MNTNIMKESINGINLIQINDYFLSKREVYLTDEVNKDTAMELLKQFMYLEKEDPNAEITFYINSPGGSVTDGMALFDYLSMMKAPIKTVCVGQAASMGAILFLAGKKRLMMPHSKVLIHDASFGNAAFSGMKPDEIKEKAEELLEVSNMLRDVVAEKTGQERKAVIAKMKKDSWFNAEEAIKFGLATGIMK